jgi:hypothetical protein
MANFKVINIPPQGVDNVWGYAGEQIDRALEGGHGEITEEDVYYQAIQGQKQLWIISNDKYKPVGACITEMADYPRKRVVRILMLGGQGLRQWSDDLQAKIEEWAIQIGAKSIEVVGRKGWARYLTRYNYEPAYTYLIKEM